MRETFRVGLIGYGYSGKTFHAPLIAATPGLELAHVYSSDPVKVHVDWPEVRVSTDCADLLGDPEVDLVVVATPNNLHFANGRDALRSGKHVVIDKPFATRYQDAAELAALAQTQGRLLTVFHNRRWDGDFLTLRALLEAGTLGAVLGFESRFDRFRPVPQQRWRESAEEGGGLWLDLGPHLLDQACQLFGRPDTLFVDLACQRGGASRRPAVDYFHALLGYGQRRVVLHASCLVAAETPRLCAFGERGSYVKYGLDTQEAALKRGQRPGPGWGRDPRDGELTLDGVTSSAPTLAGDYPAFYVGVREALRGRGAAPVSLADALAVMALLESGLQSATEGRVVTVT